MLETLLIVVVGLLPSLLSVWMLRKTQAQTRAKLRQATLSAPVRQHRSTTQIQPSDRYYLEGVGYLIGDISCRFNARCGYIRCAVNPQGPCEGCRQYEAEVFSSLSKG